MSSPPGRSAACRRSRTPAGMAMCSSACHATTTSSSPSGREAVSAVAACTGDVPPGRGRERDVGGRLDALDVESRVARLGQEPARRAADLQQAPARRVGAQPRHPDGGLVAALDLVGVVGLAAGVRVEVVRRVEPVQLLRRPDRREHEPAGAAAHERQPGVAGVGRGIGAADPAGGDGVGHGRATGYARRDRAGLHRLRLPVPVDGGRRRALVPRRSPSASRRRATTSPT